jgi:hypothetical protein
VLLDDLRCGLQFFSHGVTIVSTGIGKPLGINFHGFLACPLYPSIR